MAFALESIITQNKTLADALKDEASYLLERKKHTRYRLIGRPAKTRRILIHGAAFVITADANNKVKVWPKHSVYIVDGIIKDVFRLGRKKIPESKIDLFY